jgi:hypothetical protein
MSDINMDGLIINVTDTSKEPEVLVEVFIRLDKTGQRISIQARPVAGGEDLLNATMSRENALSLGMGLVGAVNKLPPPSGSSEPAPESLKD